MGAVFVKVLCEKQGVIWTAKTWAKVTNNFSNVQNKIIFFLNIISKMFVKRDFSIMNYPKNNLENKKNNQT